MAFHIVFTVIFIIADAKNPPDAKPAGDLWSFV